MGIFDPAPAPSHEFGVIWRRRGQPAELYLAADLQAELGVGLRAWLRLEPSRGVYCVAYRMLGSTDPVYAGRAPTAAD